MFNVENWNWAVWVVVALYALSLFISIGEHGKPRKPNDARHNFVALIIMTALLYFGGFFA